MRIYYHTIVIQMTDDRPIMSNYSFSNRAEALAKFNELMATYADNIAQGDFNLHLIANTNPANHNE